MSVSKGKYQSLLPLVQREDTLRLLIDHLVKINGVNSTTLINAMRSKLNFRDKLNYLSYLRPYFHLSSLSIPDRAIRFLIQSMNKFEDYDAFMEALLEEQEERAKLPLSKEINEELTAKSIAFLFPSQARR